jgi:hypothetical protein
VIELVPERHQLVVDHTEIKGFMGAMTMGYRTEPTARDMRVCFCSFLQAVQPLTTGRASMR